jgi:transposase InsO family protein
MLKQCLISAPLLSAPNEDGEFVLDTDSSNFAVGAVLQQFQDGQLKVIAYASKCLDQAQRNMCCTRRELYAVVWALKTFRAYLLGRESFRLRSDHAALTYLLKSPEPVGQQSRWLDLIAEYNPKIEHRSGTAHSNADALSRRPCERESGGGCPQCDKWARPAMVRRMETRSRTRRRTAKTDIANDPGTEVASTEQVSSSDAVVSFADGQKNDPDLAKLIQWKLDRDTRPTWSAVAAESDELRTLYAQWDSLVVMNGVLYRKYVTADDVVKHWQLIVPKDRRTDFVKAAHEGATGGHFGRRRTANQVSRRAYWPGWRRAVDDCCKKCDVCARVHKGRPPKYAVLQPLDVNGPMDRLHVDLCGPFVKSAGKEYILTCVDAFSRYLIAVPIPSKRAEVVAEALVRYVISVHGCARQILTDLGREYINEIYQTMLRMLHVTQLKTTPMKPSTNGRGERIHRTLHNMLAKLVADNQRDWVSVLPMCAFAYNVSTNEATGYSPYFLLHGREAICPLDLMCETPEQERPAGVPEFVEQLQMRFNKAFKCVLQTQKVRTQRMKRTYDANVKDRPFAVGDLVYYHYPRTYPGRTAKWTRFYTGPFKILKAVNDVNYVITKSPKSKPFIVHADKLKLYQGDIPAIWAGIKPNSQIVQQ